ncbi:UBP21 hydrolase, partial [Eulacestoma nigropectus]|nr:UBP21 hydrolase [Eulacestoma nigropectus]
CFMNAVLQCLSSTKPLRDYCLRRDFQQEQPPGPRAPHQQDAQEFLKFFMDRLHVEINRKGRRTPSILSDTRRPPALEDPETLRDPKTSGGAPSDPPLCPPDLFVGQLKSCLKCQACGYRSTTFEVFCDLSLPIPK